MEFALRGVGLSYGPTAVLDGVSLELRESEFTAILGPNGAGKSTLLNVLAGLRPHYRGSCRYGDREVRDWPRPEFARRIAFVQQSTSMEFPFSAEEIVLMGRTPYAHGLFESAADREAVERAMALTDVTAFRTRDVRSLSGGERQRVILAAALAQEPQTLLLDEPTTWLDLSHQLDLYRLLAKLAAEGLAVIAVTHDLNLAAAFAQRLVVLDRGRLEADGTPESVLNPDRLREVFHVDVRIDHSPAGRPFLIYGA